MVFADFLFTEFIHRVFLSDLSNQWKLVAQMNCLETEIVFYQQVMARSDAVNTNALVVRHQKSKCLDSNDGKLKDIAFFVHAEGRCSGFG